MCLTPASPRNLIAVSPRSSAIAIAGADVLEALRGFVRSDTKATWGTCAGMIMLADRLEEKGLKSGGQANLGGMDITVRRNFFGRQSESFKATGTCSMLKGTDGDEDFPAVFIRAPGLAEIGDKAEVVATVEYKDETINVAARQGNMLATAFHPELTKDTRWHELFVTQMVLKLSA